MCGRYYIDDSLEGFEELIDELNRTRRADAPEISIKTGEICPTDIAPVIARSRAQRVRPFLMQWGFGGLGQSRRPVINARCETALEKPMFRDAMLKRRCLVPATHYFEWQAQGKTRVKHVIKADAPLMYMAGIYRLEPDKPLAAFTILTREADAGIAHVHHRMPVLLPAEQAQEWLSPTADVHALLDTARGVVAVNAFQA